jgi:hypothetical protein
MGKFSKKEKDRIDEMFNQATEALHETGMIFTTILPELGVLFNLLSEILVAVAHSRENLEKINVGLLKLFEFIDKDKDQIERIDLISVLAKMIEKGEV